MNKTKLFPGELKNKETLFIYLFIYFQSWQVACMWDQAWVFHTYLHVRPILPNEHWTIWSGNNLTMSLLCTMCQIRFRGVKKQKQKMTKEEKWTSLINKTIFFDTFLSECDQYLPHGRAHSNPLRLLTCVQQCLHVDQPLLIWNVQKNNKRFNFGWKSSIKRPRWADHTWQPFYLSIWSINDEPAP